MTINDNPSQSDRKGILALSGLAAFIAGLCCMTPVVLVLLGISTLAAANALGNVLYGEHRWAFRLVALGALAAALVVYFRRRGVCTLDQARRERNRIVNTSLVVLIAATGLYLLWNYVAVHYWGIAVGLPWAEYDDERWALPLASVAIAAAVVLYFVLFRKSRRGT